MNYIFHYITNRTLNHNDIKIKIINQHILHDYEVIKHNKNYWGIFLEYENKIIGNSLVLYQKEKNIDIMLLTSVFIDQKYRGRKLCKKIVKKTIIKNERRKKTNLIKVVIAGGMPILSCLLSVFTELNYCIKKYKTKDENIEQLQKIQPKTAIKIEKINYKKDIWQTLFFEKI